VGQPCEHHVPFPFAKQQYPYCQIVVGNNPERFGRLCNAAADFIAANAAFNRRRLRERY
jgi:hypothetical protein